MSRARGIKNLSVQFDCLTRLSLTEEYISVDDCLVRPRSTAGSCSKKFDNVDLRK